MDGGGSTQQRCFCVSKTRKQILYKEVQYLRWHILIYGGLMFSQYNDFTIYKTRNIIDYVHIHYVIKFDVFHWAGKR